MRHVRKPMGGGTNSYSRANEGASDRTLCGAAITIHDLAFRAFQTKQGVERLGPNLCPECVRIRLEVSWRTQTNQKLERRAARQARRAQLAADEAEG